jgi:hypothetical protein
MTKWETFDTGSGFAVATTDRPTRRIATVPYGKMIDGKCEGYEQAEADARLIVAALNQYDPGQ